MFKFCASNRFQNTKWSLLCQLSFAVVGGKFVQVVLEVKAKWRNYGKKSLRASRLETRSRRSPRGSRSPGRWSTRWKPSTWPLVISPIVRKLVGPAQPGQQPISRQWKPRSTRTSAATSARSPGSSTCLKVRFWPSFGRISASVAEPSSRFDCKTARKKAHTMQEIA